jgi:hypothetical protein
MATGSDEDRICKRFPSRDAYEHWRDGFHAVPSKGACPATPKRVFGGTASTPSRQRARRATDQTGRGGTRPSMPSCRKAHPATFLDGYGEYLHLPRRTTYSSASSPNPAPTSTNSCPIAGTPPSCPEIHSPASRAARASPDGYEHPGSPAARGAVRCMLLLGHTPLTVGNRDCIDVASKMPVEIADERLK